MANLQKGQYLELGAFWLKKGLQSPETGDYPFSLGKFDGRFDFSVLSGLDPKEHELILKRNPFIKSDNHPQYVLSITKKREPMSGYKKQEPVEESSPF